jgi:hypothetical protein
VLAIASTLSDEIHHQPNFNRRQAKLWEMAERLGYVVALAEGLDQMSGTDVDPLRMQLRHPQEEKPEPPADPNADPNADPAAAGPGGDPNADPAAEPDPAAAPPQ